MGLLHPAGEVDQVQLVEEAGLGVASQEHIGGADLAIAIEVVGKRNVTIVEEASPYARVVATGRSDYPNQINNVLCFPGFFRGMLDVRARRVTDKMKTAAATAIGNVIADEKITPDYIIPSVFDRRVAETVAGAVASAAIKCGVAQRQQKSGIQSMAQGF